MTQPSREAMSDTEPDETSNQRAELLAARKRYNMKALGQLVDSNRLTGVARPSGGGAGPHHRGVEVPAEVPDEVEESAATDSAATEPDVDETVDELAETPTGPIADESAEESAGLDTVPVEGAAVDSLDELPSDVDGEHGFDTLFDDGERVDAAESVGPEELLEGTDRSAAIQTEPDSGATAEVATADASGDDPDETLIELRDRGARARRRPPRDEFAGPAETAPAIQPDDGVDRSEMGTQVTRTGLGGMLEVTPHAPRRDPRESGQPLARHMLDDEIQPGGRLSNPRDVPGIVLNLAKDIPAAAAVSVVRIDEEIELVGNSIDPEIEPGVLASMFSGLFRSIQVAAGALAQGPLGTVHDLVIEGEHMDLILRPLGVHYYLMVLEDRRSDQADLAATRMRMAALAPGLAAILAQGDGEV